MEQSVPALVIAVVMVVGSLMMAGVTTGALDTLEGAWREMVTSAEERVGTQLSPLTSELSADGRLLRVHLRNEGRVVLGDPRLMDVIITYRDPNGQVHTLWLPYADGPLSDNTWTVEAIGGDRRNPGLLDPGEVMAMAVQVNPPVDGANPLRWLVLVTASGLSYVVYF